ncbi:related to OTU1 |uniref:Ubiquitin thioesterase OTU n=1 Tax=Ustilago trichophora TaxID=86804 RepID=A0A5C3EII7_9BASI|nr:related to OTU1 \
MIRIRHPQGTSSHPINETSSTLAELQMFIQSQCGISPSDQELKIGYPPKALSIDSVAPETLLGDTTVGIKNGEQVIVARKPGTTSTSTSSSDPSTTPYGAPSTSSFGAMGGPKPNISTSTGPRIASFAGLGARTLDDGLTAKPAPSSSAASLQKVADGDVSIPLPSNQGKLSLKVVPDDNSCLFSSIGYLFEHRLGSDICKNLRHIVASAIRKNPDEYPDIVLGQPRESYIAKILDSKTWGGAIELAILAKHYGVELVSIDVASGGVHRFGEDVGYENRGILVYSGIHYDAMTLLGNGEETTVFPNLTAMGIPTEEDAVLKTAKELCEELKRRRYYTDTSSFSLKCKVCGTGLKGEKGALEHAKQTGHGDFGEV